MYFFFINKIEFENCIKLSLFLVLIINIYLFVFFEEIKNENIKDRVLLIAII